MSATRNYNGIFNRKVKGGALYVAIFISIIICVFLSLLILLSSHNNRTTNKILQASQLHYNLQSAFEYIQSGYFSEELNDVWIKNTLNDDSIRIKKRNWGAYLVINAETKNRHQYLSQSGIYGTCMTPDTALMISDNSRPVGMSGVVNMRAHCYLPKAGIKPAYIEGMSYQPNAANTGFIRSSPINIPLIQEKKIQDILNQQNSSAWQDSLVYALPDRLNNSFNKKTLLLEVGSQRLSNKHWQNNIKLASSGSIEIDSSCHLENVLIVAAKVKFAKGFKGRVHVIASDSIVASEDCVFQYPSSFVVINNTTANTQLHAIFFEKHCQFFGGVLAINKLQQTNSGRVFVKLNRESQINGFIYSSDYLHAEGEINATAIANTLLLKTPSAVYENHLINCEWNPKKLGHILAIPAVFPTMKRMVCCQKINT